MFDDNQGRISIFIKICYENTFLVDFLNAQIDVLSPKVLSRRHDAPKMQKKVSEIIYQQY